MAVFSDDSACCCHWQIQHQERIFEISANFNGRVDLEGTRFRRLSGKGFWFNHHSIGQLKMKLADQIIPICGKHCPLIKNDD